MTAETQKDQEERARAALLAMGLEETPERMAAMLAFARGFFVFFQQVFAEIGDPKRYHSSTNTSDPEAKGLLKGMRWAADIMRRNAGGGMNEQSAEWQACREFYVAKLKALEAAPLPGVSPEGRAMHRAAVWLAWQAISPEWERQLAEYLERKRAERESGTSEGAQ